MKNVIAGIISLGLSWGVSAETYDVSTAYTAGDEFSGELVLRVDEGKRAFFSNEHIKNISVAISNKSENRVFVDFNFEAGSHKTEAELVLDLDREVEFNFGEQTFTFFVKKHAS